MRKLYVVAFITAISFVLTTVAFAVGPGQTLEFEKGGKVVFSGDTHAKAGLKCSDCHAGSFCCFLPPAPSKPMFSMKKGGDTITMAGINAGKFCGACHKEGGTAFAPKDCTKCHKK